MEHVREEALGAIEGIFGDRLKRGQPGRPAPEGALASVFPASAEEVALLARITDRYSLPLAALGAQTTPEKWAKEGRVLIRFDLMRSLWLSDADEPLVEAEPGALLLELNNALRVRGRGLTVYPTSAPRATIGGWLALDGVGVGSLEYGRVSENVVSAEVVIPGGIRRTVGGDELHSVIGRERGIVVRASLQTRRAEDDTPYALAFGDHEKLADAVAGIFRRGVPLWHLAFLSPEMARIRGLGENHLIFGPTLAGGKWRSGRRSLRLPHRPVGAVLPRRTIAPHASPLGQGFHPGRGDPGSIEAP
jgi:FAD/FMN-containing dehydrogenase